MWSPQNRHFCAKSIKNSRKQVKNGSFSAIFWSKWRDSNSRPPVPETGALPTALHLEMVKNMRFSVSGQTCGQTENLRTFKTSREPKKSVFSRDLGVFQKINFEIGGLHPKLARYQLRYTSIIEKIRIWELAHKSEFDDCSASICQRQRNATCHRICDAARKEYTIFKLDYFSLVYYTKRRRLCQVFCGLLWLF